MAAIPLRRTENAPGPFFVDSTCIDCDLCRQIAPATFASIGDMSAVVRQPVTPEETDLALRALVTCPTVSIGAAGRFPVRRAAEAYPEPIADGVHFCGYAAESSFGASSYFIVRPGGNVLVDSPRFSSRLARRMEALGGVRLIFLTHRDDVADHARWARRFGATRILHADDVDVGTEAVEQRIEGARPVRLAPDLLAIPTPGHTAGHQVLLYEERFLFSGDHIWWSPNRRMLWASRRVCWHSWPQQLESLRQLLDLRFEWLLPGHGRRLRAAPTEMRHHLERTLRALEKPMPSS